MSSSDYTALKKLKSIKNPALYETRDSENRTEIKKITTIVNGITKNDFGVAPYSEWFDVTLLPVSNTSLCSSLWSCGKPTDAPNEFPAQSPFNPPSMTTYPPLKTIKLKYPCLKSIDKNNLINHNKKNAAYYNFNYIY